MSLSQQQQQEQQSPLSLPPPTPPPIHLLLVIPGMGARAEKQVLPTYVPMAEWFNTKYCCSQLQNSLDNELKQMKKYSDLYKCPSPIFEQQPPAQASSPSPSSSAFSCFEIAHVDYSTTVRVEHGMDNLLSMITPKAGVPMLRQLANQTFIDVLAYVSSETISKQIRQVVICQSNKLYRDFCEKNKNSGRPIKVSIVAHSLGTVVAYDLLKEAEQIKAEQNNSNNNTTSDCNSNTLSSEQQLEFEVHDTFLLGSPLGLFLAMREGAKQEHVGDVVNSDLTPSSSNHLLSKTKVYHLYHPYDPVAYRIEPLLDTRFANIPPVELSILDLKKLFQEKATALGTLKPSEYQLKWNTFVNDVFSGVQSTFASVTQQQPKATNEPDEALKTFGRRIDYVVQPDTVLNEYLVSTEVHLRYWSNPIVTHFILKQLEFL